MKKHILIFLCMISIFFACERSTDFKEIRDFRGNEWKSVNKQVFEFNIEDTLKTYTFNYLLRNTVSYPFFNIYLSQSLIDPDGKQISNSMDEIILFNEKTGKPYGDGLGDIFDNRVSAPKLNNLKLTKKGKYKWSITHNMRPDPLTGIMSIGVEVLGVKSSE